MPTQRKERRGGLKINADASIYNDTPRGAVFPADVHDLFCPPRTLGVPDDVYTACDNQLASSGVYDLIGHSLELGQLPQINRLGYAILQQISQNGMVRACVETTADDMTRNFIELKREGEQAAAKPTDPAEAFAEALGLREDEKREEQDAQLAQLDEELRRLKVQKVLHEACALVGYMGGALVFIDTGETDPSLLKQPLNLSEHSAELQQTRTLRLVPVDPINVFPGLYNSMSPLRPDYFRPRTWWVMGQEVHASRFLRMVANEVPVLLKPVYNFFGIAQAQILWDYVMHFESNRDAVNRLLGKFSLTVFKTNMEEVLTQAAGLSELDKRIGLLVQYRNNDGVQVIDKESEDIVKLETPLVGMTDVVRQSLEILAAVNRTPAVKLLGISPSGFNATGESDLRNYYDHIQTMQEKMLRPAMQTILKVLQIRLFGKVDPTITFDFAPLSEADKAAQAATQKTRADTMAVLLDRQIVSPEECRKVLADNPDSGFSDIDVDAMPEPQGAPGMAEQMAGFAGEGANGPERPAKIDDADKAGEVLGDSLLSALEEDGDA